MTFTEEDLLEGIRWIGNQSVSLLTTIRRRSMGFVKISGSRVEVCNVKPTGDGIEFDVGPADGALFEEQPVFKFIDDSAVAFVYIVAGVSPRGMDWTVAAVPSPRSNGHS
jgi:hypothetical protein